jgi:hypothetical protein
VSRGGSVAATQYYAEVSVGIRTRRKPGMQRKVGPNTCLNGCLFLWCECVLCVFRRFFKRRPGWSDENPLRIPWPEVCPGDIVILNAGDAVLADIRLISTTNNLPIVTRGVRSGNIVTDRIGTRQKCASTAPPGSAWYLAQNMIWVSPSVTFL